MISPGSEYGLRGHSKLTYKAQVGDLILDVHVMWGSEKVGVQSYMASHFTNIGVYQAQRLKAIAQHD
jgi:hypothetical protein